MPKTSNKAGNCRNITSFIKTFSAFSESRTDDRERAGELHMQRSIRLCFKFVWNDSQIKQMMEMTTVKFYALEYRDTRTYWMAALFIAGNILLPQLCHLVPGGGLRWLPIYFFTLIGAYKYGWRVGLLTALASPLVNSALFGMPAAGALPAILLKSALLAGAAGFAAFHFRRASLLLLATVVLAYQTVGTLGEWVMKGDLFLALQDFRIGVPGMLVQVFGGWFVINFLTRK